MRETPTCRPTHWKLFPLECRAAVPTVRTLEAVKSYRTRTAGTILEMTNLMSGSAWLSSALARRRIGSSGCFCSDEIFRNSGCNSTLTRSNVSGVEGDLSLYAPSRCLRSAFMPSDRGLRHLLAFGTMKLNCVCPLVFKKVSRSKMPLFPRPSFPFIEIRPAKSIEEATPFFVVKVNSSSFCCAAVPTGSVEHFLRADACASNGTIINNHLRSSFSPRASTFAFKYTSRLEQLGALTASVSRWGSRPLSTLSSHLLDHENREVTSAIGWNATPRTPRSPTSIESTKNLFYLLCQLEPDARLWHGLARRTYAKRIEQHNCARWLYQRVRISDIANTGARLPIEFHLVVASRLTAALLVRGGFVDLIRTVLMSLKRAVKCLLQLV